MPVIYQLGLRAIFARIQLQKNMDQRVVCVRSASVANDPHNGRRLANPDYKGEPEIK